jgi:hypothetical protein
MKHLIVFPAWVVLFLISLTLGCIMYLWDFNFNTFKKGSRFINTKLIQFTNWYQFSKI